MIEANDAYSIKQLQEFLTFYEETDSMDFKYEIAMIKKDLEDYGTRYYDWFMSENSHYGD